MAVKTERGPYNFFVTGDPVPKQSFKVTGSNKVLGYTPARVKAWQETVGWTAKQIWNSDPIDEPMRITLEFYRSTKIRVDLDNLSKAVLDGLQGILFVNDAQVCELYLSKHIVGDPADAGVRVDFWILTEEPRA